MIPICEPVLDVAESHALQKCITSNWIGSGPRVEEFERKWADYCGAAYGVAVSNGTVALQLAIAALDLKPGSEVIMPSFTIMSCPLAAIRNNLIPVLVDVDPETWCIDCTKLDAALSSKTKAIMPVHMFGHPANMFKINDFATRHHLFVIEDAAQAHGATFTVCGNIIKCGNGGDLNCFSFYSNKLVTTGEGGMVLTNFNSLAVRLRSLRNLCFGSGIDRFKHVGLGYNFRMTDMQASLGIVQIDKLSTALVKKRLIGQRYRDGLRHPSIRHQNINDNCLSTNWMHGIVCRNPHLLAMHLSEYQIETRPFFYGLHKQSVLSGYVRLVGDSYPVTDLLGHNGLYLPSSVNLSESDQQFVIDKIMEVL